VRAIFLLQNSCLFIMIVGCSRSNIAVRESEVKFESGCPEFRTGDQIDVIMSIPEDLALKLDWREVEVNWTTRMKDPTKKQGDRDNGTAMYRGKGSYCIGKTAWFLHVFKKIEERIYYPGEYVFNIEVKLGDRVFKGDCTVKVKGRPLSVYGIERTIRGPCN